MSKEEWWRTFRIILAYGLFAFASGAMNGWILHQWWIK